MMQDGAFVIVSLGAKLHPKALIFAPAPGKVEALVGRAVDIASPEATKPTTPMYVLMRCAPKLHVKIPRGTQSKARGAFQVESWGGRLMQLGLLVVEFFESHWRTTRLKENVVTIKFCLAVEDMLKIQTGIRGHEDAACAGFMLKIPDAIVSRSVSIGGLMTRIIADEGGDITHL